MKTKHLVSGLIWGSLYVILTLTPLVILLTGPKSSGRPPLLDFSVSLGFSGLAIMALQFVTSARLKFFNQPFGTDIVYHFHRQIGIAAFLMVFAHPLLLFILDARYLRLLNLISAPWRARFGVLAIILLIGVVWMAEYRQKLKIPYGFWKVWHGILATMMVGLALLHIFNTGDYTNLPWKRAVWIGYTILFLLMLIYTRIIYPLKLMRNPYIVKEIHKERGDVWTAALAPAKGKALRFMPGQFAWLTAWKTPFSDSEHPFSLASSSEQDDHIEMSIKNLGKFTAKIQALKPGDKVYVDGPYGSFSIDRYPQAKNLVFIPGGIGVTPIMSMLRSMAERGDKRPVRVLYANQTWDATTFREEMETLQKKLNMQLVYIIERPDAGWKGESGFLNADIIRKYVPAEWLKGNSDVFLCGPAPMMNAVEKALMQAGFNESQIHSERFALG
jgi:predicted ferric reductase